jgi:hypothetical protein
MLRSSMNSFRAVVLLAIGISLTATASAKGILRQDAGREGKLILRGAVVTYPVLKPAGGLARQPVQGISLRRTDATPRAVEKLKLSRVQLRAPLASPAPVRFPVVATQREPIANRSTAATPEVFPVVSVPPAGVP